MSCVRVSLRILCISKCYILCCNSFFLQMLVAVISDMTGLPALFCNSVVVDIKFTGLHVIGIVRVWFS